MRLNFRLPRYLWTDDSQLIATWKQGALQWEDPFNLAISSQMIQESEAGPETPVLLGDAEAFDNCWLILVFWHSLYSDAGKACYITRQRPQIVRCMRHTMSRGEFTCREKIHKILCFALNWNKRAHQGEFQHRARSKARVSFLSHCFRFLLLLKLLQGCV